MLTKIEQYVVDSVKKRRKDQKMSRETLAFCSNLSPSFIRDVEDLKSRAKYNMNHLNEFAKVFNCSPKDFLPDDFFEDNKDKSGEVEEETIDGDGGEE